MLLYLQLTINDSAKRNSEQINLFFKSEYLFRYSNFVYLNRKRKAVVEC